jgi:dihydroorotate dehydrogenase electron transfer subunit
MQQTRKHRVTRVRTLSGGCFVLEVEGPIPETLAGQFYMLRTESQWPVMLPRPFSLYGRGSSGQSGSFLMKGIGPGTNALRDCESGDEVWVTGPLGRPFPEEIENPVCIAGGIGLAPFLLLAERQVELGRVPARLLFGGRNAALLAGMQDFDDLADVHPCTDDGSHGFHGLVTDLLASLIEKGVVTEGETAFCCGPDPMMHAVARMCAERGLRCYLSLENYMACGYGVCNGCSVEVQGPRFAGWPYSKTCLQGPVYEASELVLPS